MGRPGAGPPFFYMYACFFSDLHVSLPFDTFTMGVLRALNVVPTQVHPNTWASLQTFRLLCDVMRLHPTPSSFLSYYASHPAKKAFWLSLVGRPVGRLMCYSTFLLVLIRGLKSSLLRSSFGQKRRLSFLTSSVGRGFPSTGLVSPLALKNGRGRRRVPMSWRFSRSLMLSRGGFHAGG